jgi:hypothetical protein
VATKKTSSSKRAAPPKPRPKTKPAPDPGATVGDFLRTLEHPRKVEAKVLRDLILGVNPRIGEEIKWNAPSFHLDQQHFATYHLRTSDLQLILHRGAKASGKKRPQIRDPKGRLEWLGEERARLRVTSAEDIEEHQGALQVILRDWIAGL